MWQTFGQHAADFLSKETLHLHSIQKAAIPDGACERVRGVVVVHVVLLVLAVLVFEVPGRGNNLDAGLDPCWCELQFFRYSCVGHNTLLLQQKLDAH